MPANASCADLKLAIEQAAFSHGVAFTCATVSDASGCFLPDQLPLTAVLANGSAVFASASSLIDHRHGNPGT